LGHDTVLSSGPSLMRRHFSEKQRSCATGGNLYFMRARFYPSLRSRAGFPMIGRFLQPDSVVPDPSNPQSLNRYSYVLNNPLRYTDPTGHDPFENCSPTGGGCFSFAPVPTGTGPCAVYGCAGPHTVPDPVVILVPTQPPTPPPPGTPEPPGGCTGLACVAEGVTGLVAEGVEHVLEPVGQGALYCAARVFFECIERAEMAALGVDITIFGAVIVGGGCFLSATVVGPATAGIGGVVGCGLATFAGTTVAYGGILITKAAFSEWRHRE